MTGTCDVEKTGTPVKKRNAGTLTASQKVALDAVLRLRDFGLVPADAWTSVDWGEVIRYGQMWDDWLNRQKYVEYSSRSRTVVFMWPNTTAKIQLRAAKLEAGEKSNEIDNDEWHPWIIYLTRSDPWKDDDATISSIEIRGWSLLNVGFLSKK